MSEQEEEEGPQNEFQVSLTDGAKISEFKFKAPSKRYGTAFMRMVSQLPLILEKITPATTHGLRMRKATLSTVINDYDELLVCDCTSGAIQVDLPLALSGSRELLIVKIDGTANAVTIECVGVDTITGETEITLTSQYDKAVLVSDSNVTWIRLL